MEELFLVKQMESFKGNRREDAISRFVGSLKYKKGYFGIVTKDTVENRFWIRERLYEIEWTSASISHRNNVNGHWYIYRVIEDCITRR